MNIYIQIILAIYQFHSYTTKILNFTEENINKLFFINNNESNILIYEFNDTKYILKNVKYIVILNDFTNLENINDSNRYKDYKFLQNIIPDLYHQTSIENKLKFLVDSKFLSNEVDNYQDYKPYSLKNLNTASKQLNSTTSIEQSKATMQTSTASLAPQTSKFTYNPYYWRLHDISMNQKTNKIPMGCGFTNIGNTCYLNVTLQLFLHMDPLNDLIRTISDTNTILHIYKRIYNSYMLETNTKSTVSTSKCEFMAIEGRDGINYIKSFLEYVNKNNTNNDFKLEAEDVSVFLNAAIKAFDNEQLKDLFDTGDKTYVYSNNNNQYHNIKFKKNPEIILIEFTDYTQYSVKILKKFKDIYTLKGIIIGKKNEKNIDGHYVYLSLESDNKWYYYNDNNYDKIDTYEFFTAFTFKENNHIEVNQKLVINNYSIYVKILYYENVQAPAQTSTPSPTPAQTTAQTTAPVVQAPTRASTVPAAQSQTSQTDFTKYTINDKDNILKNAIIAAVGTNLDHSYNKYNQQKGGKKSKSKLKNKSKKLKGGIDDRFKNIEYRLWAANKLRECYPEKFKFSDWVIKKEKFYNYLFGETMVLYDNNDALDEVIKTVYYRDPVNITFNRYYDAKILYKNFNYNQANYLNNLYYTDNNNTYKMSYGGDIYDCMSSLDKETKDFQLKPNIAVFCNATINCNTGHFNKLYINVNLKNINVNVLNLIGYGFDFKTQPDYKYIENIKKNNRLLEVIKLYRKMWLKLAHFCKIYNNSKTKIEDKIINVILSNVGGGVFSSSINDLLELQNYNFYHNIFIPSFGNKENNNLIENLESPYYILNNLNINTKITFDDKNSIDNKYYVPNIIYNISQINTLDNSINKSLLQDLKTPTLKNTLFINAWDPHSIIGNGNSNDNSLDGYWGHISNMSVLGWGFTNPEMTYVPVDFANM
jgi:hypothetical protein